MCVALSVPTHYSILFTLLAMNTFAQKCCFYWLQQWITSQIAHLAGETKSSSLCVWAPTPMQVRSGRSHLKRAAAMPFQFGVFVIALLPNFQPTSLTMVSQNYAYYICGCMCWMNENLHACIEYRNGHSGEETTGRMQGRTEGQVLAYLQGVVLCHCRGQ